MIESQKWEEKEVRAPLWVSLSCSSVDGGAGAHSRLKAAMLEGYRTRNDGSQRHPVLVAKDPEASFAKWGRGGASGLEATLRDQPASLFSAFHRRFRNAQKEHRSRGGNMSGSLNPEEHRDERTLFPGC